LAIWLRASWLELLGVCPDEIVPLTPEPGRWMTLQLRTIHGNLDITSVYLQSGQRPAKRGATIERGLAALRSSVYAANWLAGDWNFAAETDGRWCYTNGCATGDGDAAESRRWTALASKHDLVELFQDAHTHMTSTTSSRLDRIYTSCHLANKQDREFYVSPGRWCPEASAHRPLLGGCRTPAQVGRPAVMRPDVIQDPRWSYYVRVASTLTHLRGVDSAFLQLRRLKLCIWEAHDAVEMERRGSPLDRTPPRETDRVAVAMQALRAREKGQAGRAHRLYHTWPWLAHIAPLGATVPLQDAVALTRWVRYSTRLMMTVASHFKTR
jgi:hypothetical protein